MTAGLRVKGATPLLKLRCFGIIIYSKATIQAVKKGAAKSSSPTQDSQGEKFVKSRWRPRNSCDGRSMEKNFLLKIIQSICVLH